MNIELNNKISNNIEQEQNKFMQSTLGKVINTALNIGLRYLLPNIIEDEVINIKDKILNNGFKEGVNEAISQGINLGKSAIGIVTGKFDNISQMEKAVEQGGIIESVSDVLDKTLNKVNDRGILNSSITTIIKGGKDIILDTVNGNIKELISEQKNEMKKIEKNIREWNQAFNEKDFNKMEEKIGVINNYLEKVLPIENVIKNARYAQNMHMLVKNNNKKFDIDEISQSLAKSFA